jgi:hypothetical protein
VVELLKFKKRVLLRIKHSITTTVIATAVLLLGTPVLLMGNATKPWDFSGGQGRAKLTCCWED